MGSITKSAMKAIKFYKHVVQSVEKFILKCKPEYKIPGLYVIDSIVRQSRHQFGAEKDVFAPRFARNMEETFAHLFRCSQEDKVRSPPQLPPSTWWFTPFLFLEQNHSRTEPLAEEQCLRTRSDSAALRSRKSRSSSAPSFYPAAAATGSDSWPDKWTEYPSGIATNTKGGSSWWNGRWNWGEKSIFRKF